MPDIEDLLRTYADAAQPVEAHEIGERVRARRRRRVVTRAGLGAVAASIAIAALASAVRTDEGTTVTADERSGRDIFVGSGPGGISLYDADTGDLIRTVVPDGSAQSIAANGDLYTWAGVGDGCTSEIRRITPEGDVEVIERQDGVVAREPAVSPDGQALAWIEATCASPNTSLVVRRSVETFRFPIASTSQLTALSWAPDNRRLAYQHQGPNTIEVLDAFAASSLSDADVVIEEPSEPCFGGGHHPNNPSFLADGSLIYTDCARALTTPATDRRARALRWDAATRAAVEVFRLEGTDQGAFPAVVADLAVDGPGDYAVYVIVTPGSARPTAYRWKAGRTTRLDAHLDQVLIAPAPGASTGNKNPDEAADSPTRLATDMNVWPADNDPRRAGAVDAAMAFVTEVTGEAPVEATPRPTPNELVPTYVDVRLRGGATVEVLTAPEGDKGWRILQAGQPAAVGGVASADVSAGPAVIGQPSPARLRFEAPPDAHSARILYATSAGTFSVDLDRDVLARGSIDLPRTRTSTASAGLGSVALVYRSDQGDVLAIRAIAFDSVTDRAARGRP